MTIQCTLELIDSKLFFFRDTGEKVCQASPNFSKSDGRFEGLCDFQSFEPTIVGPVSIILPHGTQIVASIFAKFAEDYIADVTTCFAIFRKKDIAREGSVELQAPRETPKNLSVTYPPSPSSSKQSPLLLPASDDDGEGFTNIYLRFYPAREQATDCDKNA